MTSLPIHTVQHVKSVFKKYQIIAILFTTITIAAAFLTAISGFQLAKLRKMELTQTSTAAQPAKTAPVVPANDALEKQIKTLENQLAAEKTTSQELRIKIQELEKKIAALKGTPQQTNVPAAAAPAAKTPAQAQPAAESKAVPALPKLTPPPAPAPAPASPEATTIQETKSTTPGKITPPATTQPDAQPTQPPAQKDQSLQKPAPTPATTPSAPTTASPQAQPLKEDSLPSSQNTGTDNPAKP